MKRTGSIELMRIFAAVLVVAVHFSEFFLNIDKEIAGFLSIYVEFFFMIAGFYMLMHLDKTKTENENTADYTLHRIKAFWAPLCIVNFVHLFLNCTMAKVTTVAGVLEKLWHFKWELLLLQCAGFIQKPAFNNDYLIGANWYLSALMLATVILYPVAKNYRKIYSNIVCPIVILAVYCGFSQAYGTINVGNEFLFGITDALARGLAGICVGSVCYNAYILLEKKESSTAETVLDCAAWIMLPLSIVIAGVTKNNSGLFMVIPFGIIITEANLNRAPISKILNKIPAGVSGLAGRLSLYIYLAHWTVILAVKHFMTEGGTAVKAVTVVVSVLVYAAALYLIDKKRKGFKPVLIICAAVFAATLVTCGAGVML